MTIVIIRCMILVGFVFIYGGWKGSYDEISPASDIWIFELIFSIMEKFFKVSAKKLCVTPL
ncbi:hypothetical protein CHH47_26815 [Priestia megaterium]|jgi:hypothetical protein|nr:hypothetical protein CHH47_26815 [Priestia megaterium]